MGINETFALKIVLGMGYSWRASLGITFLIGIITLLIALLGVRKQLIRALPEYFRIGLAVGVCIFIIFIFFLFIFNLF